MSYDIVWTTKFKKDYKRAMKRNWNIDLLDEVIRMLAAGQTLPPIYRDHALIGNFKGCRECHVGNDWLLMYYYEENELVLTLLETGSHADLFGK
ncbi:MAG: type II toxin-antitoxin system YafQ family toxin [Clostridia bacterium]|nr:type II toxin-antitoxin system YafQ family toxin [Clostridia bacterium]